MLWICLEPSSEEKFVFNSFNKNVNKDYVKMLVDEAIERLQQKYDKETLTYRKAAQEYYKYLDDKINTIKINNNTLLKENEILRKEYKRMNKNLFYNEDFIEMPEDYEIEMKKKKYKSFEDILTKRYTSKQLTDIQNSQKNNRINTKIKKIDSNIKLKTIKSKWYL
ncbi:Hypothetical protein SRAE_2000480600 [Strongyloides ratti]|uniref:Uncharacterized protein n=1 Tax=Strongyloides ratti TaxID=34506 RepID=A0A090LK59_STRRB|nr:Hypothetical protein SRAE_2000480600 [Strongyloides ratti]CEF70172.1 Hypothetical protein SRAE_2000480600 [Strongyloides ratti]